MDVRQDEEQLADSHVDWAFLPPTAMHVIGTLLAPSSLLRARTVNRHWASCLAGVVDTLYIVPEYFLNEDTAHEVANVFPKAVTVNLDLQDTFMAVPEAVKDSLERYTAQRAGSAQPGTSQLKSEASLAAAAPDGQAQVAASSTDGSRGDCGCPAGQVLDGPAAEGAQTSPPSGSKTSLEGGPSAPSSCNSNPPTGAAAPWSQDSKSEEEKQAARPSSQPAPSAPAQPVAVAGEPAQQAQEQQQQQQQQQLPPTQQQQQQLEPMAALAAAFAAAGFMNGGNQEAAVHGVAANPMANNAIPQPAPAPGPAASPPTFPFSAIPVEPLPGVVPPGATHLRIRLPDAHDVQAHYADMSTSWDYISGLLGRVGPKLSGLSLSTAPDAAHIGMLAPLTHLTSLTMDEASHATWSTEHLPIVGSLTNLCSLAIKIPPFRNTRPEPNAPATTQQPAALSSWSSLQRLTKLHVSALRYTYHSSLVSVLPYLTKLEYLALRAPQTRLPWPGTDRPLFANIGLLTGLSQLSLALGDHNMAPLDWQSLTTLGKLSAIEISVSEGSDGLNVPGGLEFPALRNLKLRYPNSQDLVRIAAWSGICKLDIKFPEHEREWHQEDAVVELMDFRNKLQPTTGAAVIAAVLDNAPGAITAAGGAAGGAAASGANGGSLTATTGAAALAGGIAAVSLGHVPSSVGTTALAAFMPAQATSAAIAAAGSVGGGMGAGVFASSSTAPTGAGSMASLTAWWSPLLPLLALPNMTDFRCSAKEGLASRDPILFDEIVVGLCAAWPAITRLCFKGYINVASQQAGWDALKVLTRLQQLELRHHPPQPPDENQENAIARAARNQRYSRVEPIKLPATSLPDSLQTLLLENVELRRKETDCLVNLTSLERRTTCRHFPEFVGMPLQRLVVSNCCVKAKGISSIAKECAGLTHLVFAVYKVTEQADMRELQAALKEMVSRLKQLQVLKIRVLAGCITQELVTDMVTHLPHLQRLKLTSSDGWADTGLFLPLTRMSGLRKCSLAYFKNAEAARLLRQEFRLVLPYCKIKAKQEAT